MCSGWRLKTVALVGTALILPPFLSTVCLVCVCLMCVVQGFIITFIFPALLQLSSRKMMKDVFQVDSAKVPIPT